MSSTNGFPFLSKRTIADMICTDRAYALDVFKILLARTEQRAAGSQGGFMASHKTTVRQLADVLAKRPLDDAEHAKLVAILVHYSRQLAAHFRAVDLQARPELLSVASTFSAIPAATSGPTTATAKEDEVTAPVTESLAVVAAPAPRRRGRPPGSKSKKARPEPEHPKRRRRRA